VSINNPLSEFTAMLKKFVNHADALAFAKATGNRLGARILFKTIYSVGCHESKTAVFGPTSFHLCEGASGDYSPATGFYFGGSNFNQANNDALWAMPENDGESDDIEKAMALVGANCYAAQDKLLEIAKSLAIHKTCVWHESARIFGRLDSCE
jgi:hypothetical protein